MQNIVSFIGSCAKETYNFKEPANRSHPIPDISLLACSHSIQEQVAFSISLSLSSSPFLSLSLQVHFSLSLFKKEREMEQADFSERESERERGRTVQFDECRSLLEE